jgi:group I intron endonuclease
MINLNNLSMSMILTRNLSRGLPKLTNSPILTYNNAEELKSLIFKENINKSFVYRWTNKVNGKTYLGSTTNAKSRLQTYYDNYTLNLINMPIYKAILKYGHSNFIFDIIEYCEPADTVQKEQFYLDNFDFDYNVLEKANSSLGYKHTEETIEKMKGRQNLLGYKHTDETKDNLKKLQTNKKHSLEDLEKMREI